MVARAVAAVEDAGVDMAQQLVVILVVGMADDQRVGPEAVEAFYRVVKALVLVEGR